MEFNWTDGAEVAELEMLKVYLSFLLKLRFAKTWTHTSLFFKILLLLHLAHTTLSSNKKNYFAKTFKLLIMRELDIMKKIFVV